MTRISILALAAITAVTPIYALGQVAPPPPVAPTSPAAPAVNVPKPLPTTEKVAQTPGVTLRSLPAVLDARERRQDWHVAAQQAGARIQDPAIKSQFNQRMAGVVPSVAKILMEHPQDYALVTVGVYRNKEAPDKQAMVAVTLDGLDTQLGSDFFAEVVSGQPQIPGGEGLPTGLSLDTEATSYIVFYLGEKQLEGGDIAHATFGKSIMLATNKVQKDADSQAVAAAVSAQRANANVAQAQATAQSQANQTAAAAANNDGQAAGYVASGATNSNGYAYGNGYPIVNDGYYYPGVGVPIVILPGEEATSPDIQKRQSEREHRLERDYQKRRTSLGAATAVNGVQSEPRVGTGPNTVNGVASSPRGAQSPVTGVQSAPPTGVTPATGSTPVQPNGANPTQGKNAPVTFPQPGQPGGAPAGAKPTAPAPAETSGPNGSAPSGVPHPAAGAPGGAPAPAAGGKK